MKAILPSLLALVLLSACLKPVCGRKTVPHGDQLFNGRDLTGWVAMHGGSWMVEDGVIVLSLIHI